MSVALRGIAHAFEGTSGRVEALAPIDLDVADHEFVCVVGPSGCGKSTLLRIVAGIIPPTAGAVSFGPDPMTAERRTAMVFQDHGLLPWMDVVDNVAFGLEAAGVPRRERRERAGAFARRVGLAGFEGAYPHQLSGGMRQRVGIARALLAEPQVLLMDEPFGSLDAQTRLVLQDELVRTWRGEDDTVRKDVLYVTHDIDEAVRLGDRIVVLSGRPGRVVADLPVPIARPRAYGGDVDAAAVDLRRQVWALLEEEVRHGTDA